MAKKKSRKKSTAVKKVVKSVEEEVKKNYILVTKPFILDVKKFRFPAKITQKCGGCGKDIIYDFNKVYLPYPEVNQEFDFDIYCKLCRWSKPVKLNLTICLELIENGKEDN